MPPIHPLPPKNTHKAGGRLDARHVRMNTGKGAVEARVPGLPVNPDAPGPLANKVGLTEGLACA